MKTRVQISIEDLTDHGLYILLLLYVFSLPFQGILSFGSGVTYIFKYSLIGLMLTFIWICYPYAFQLQDRFRLFLLLIGLCYGVWATVLTIINGGDAIGVAESVSLSVLLVFSSLLIFLLEYHRWHIQILRFLVFSSALALFISWIFFVGKVRILLPPEFRHITPNRLYGVIKSPNATAYLAFCGLLSVVTLTAKKFMNIHLGQVFSIFFLVSFIFTFSKASFLGFMFVCVYIGLKGKELIKKVFGNKTILKHLLVVMLGVVLLYHFGGFGSRHSSMFNRNALLDILRIKRNVVQTGNRMLVWSYALDIIEDHWLFGIGPANWKKFFYSYGMEEEYDSPHNGFLEVLGGIGVFGLGFYLLLIFFIWQRSAMLDSLIRLSVRSLLVFTVTREIVEVSTIFNCVINGMLFWLLIAIFFSFNNFWRESEVSGVTIRLWKLENIRKGR